MRQGAVDIEDQVDACRIVDGRTLIVVQAWVEVVYTNCIDL